MRPIFRVLMWPFSILYSMVVRFRNHLYDIGYKKSFTFQCMVISVGNLSVGGNGKTPMVEYLVRLIGPKNLAVLSRGYGRRSRGFRLADKEDAAADIGDEPLQMFNKFYPDLTVAVGEERALAIPKILWERPEIRTIVLDDAFQHRAVNPQLSILVTDYWRPFYEDFVLPAGRLREARKGASRAQIVVVTKCPPDLAAKEQAKIEQQIFNYHATAKVFFTSITYQPPTHFQTGEILDPEASILLISGIANADTLEDHISKTYKLVKHMRYRDHFRYGDKEIKDLGLEFEQMQQVPKAVLTTEKDLVRLMMFEEQLNGMPIYSLPIACNFISDENKFQELVLNSLRSVENSKT